MAEADIAYVATAGASGLALAASLWAWRFRVRVNRRLAEAEAAERSASEAVMAQWTAVSAFDELLLPLHAEPAPTDGGESVLGSPLLLARAASAFAPRAANPDEGAEEIADPASALLGGLEARLAEPIDRLREAGEPFDAALEGWRIAGRAAAGMAWLRLSPGTAETRDGGSTSRFADASPLPTWVLDRSGRLVWANRAWLAEVRAENLEAAQQAGSSFDRGADAVAAEALRLGQRHEGFRWTSAGGRRRAWRIVAEPLADGRDAVLVFAIDVTEAEETRDTLRRHVEAHDETLNHLADAVAIFGPSRRLAFHNTAFQALFDLDAAWLDERPTHGELLDRLRQRRLLPETIDYAGWKTRELEFYGASAASPDDSWSLPDGRTLRVVRQPHPLGGILLIFSDMTDELKLRSRFNAQIQVQTATLDKLNDAVAVFGSDGRLRLHNDAFERFWSLSSEQLRGAGDFDSIAALCRAVLPDPALWLGLKARVADPDPESRVPIAGEARATDGRIAAWQTRPLPDGATLVAFSDVTARRELEQALAEREQALRETQELKREFVGNVSYELRTPLTTIVGYSELLEALGDLPERSRQHAGAIRVAASHLARSIDDVLDMAEIDAGEMALNLEDLPLAELLAQAADRVRPKVEGRGGSLEVSCPAGIGLVRGDARRLAQAVDHLLDNAARAIGEEGVVRLSADRTPTEVRIRVSDTGRGIPYHLQPNVFDRFVRRERGGPGVALALVKALVELHGGWAEVESEPGSGSTFILHLPVEAQAGLKAG